MNSESVRIYLVAAMGEPIGLLAMVLISPGKFRVSRRFFADSLREKSLSWGERPLSLSASLYRTVTLVISRQANYRATGCVVVSTLSHAIALASELGNELYVAGGAEIYTLALPHATACFYLRYIKPSRVTPSSQCSTKQNSSLSQPKPFKL